MGLLNFIFYSLTHYEKSLISKRTTKMVIIIGAKLAGAVGAGAPVVFLVS